MVATYSRTILIAHGSERGTCPVDAGGAVVVGRVHARSPPRPQLSPCLAAPSRRSLCPSPAASASTSARPTSSAPPARLSAPFPLLPSQSQPSLPLGPPEDLLRLRSPSCRPQPCGRAYSATALRLPSPCAQPLLLGLLSCAAPSSLCTRGRLHAHVRPGRWVHTVHAYRPNRALNGAHRTERTLPTDTMGC